MIALIERAHVQNANAMCGQHFISTAPILQATMFAHRLGRELQMQPSATALLHHDAQLLGETFYGRHQPQQRRGAVFIDATDYSSKNRYALALQPTASAHLTVSILLRFDGPVDRDGIERLLRTARFCGGQIIRVDDVVTFDDEESALARCRSGRWIVERSDLVDPDDPLSSMLDALARTPGRKAEKPAAQEADSIEAGTKTGTSEVEETADEDSDDKAEYPDFDGLPLSDLLDGTDTPRADSKSSQPDLWLSPAALGYAMTTSFQRRAGVRADVEHAFAETLVGLVQFVSVRYHPPRIPWWHHDWPAEDMFVVRQEHSEISRGAIHD